MESKESSMTSLGISNNLLSNKSMSIFWFLLALPRD